MALRVTALAGGVGGAKLADGLDQLLPQGALTVIVNTGDDFDHFGLHISPDLDTVVYTLAGVANSETGWGRAQETWNALTTLERLEGPTWFRLGDKDLGMHLARTHALQAGQSLSEFTSRVCRSLGIEAQVLPMTDDRVRTVVHTVHEGDLPFQDYFVRKACEPTVRGFSFTGAERSTPAPGVVEALESADLIVLCPSNPWVSLDPIFAVPGVRAAVLDRAVIGVSPIIGERALKGPAAKISREMGSEPSAAAVARHFRSVLNGWVIDEEDREQKELITAMQLECLITDAVMHDRQDRARLAREIITYAERSLLAGVSS
ncbi:MAG: 2-phospho-L-lactate transferase [Anaerolineales bacterium]|nr:2-phospho-L-lactate transferase [Anaerolineales bacterium]